MRHFCFTALLASLCACAHPQPASSEPAAEAPPPVAPAGPPPTPEAAPPPAAPAEPAPPPPSAPAPAGPRVTLTGASGPATVRVRLAVSKAELEKGLAFERQLPKDEGMLFLFDEDQDRTFWMKDTPIALDIIFIDLRMDVVGVVRNARPMTTTTRSVGRLSRYVLEVNAGWADAHGIDTGARAAFTGVTLP